MKAISFDLVVLVISKNLFSNADLKALLAIKPEKKEEKEESTDQSTDVR